MWRLVVCCRVRAFRIGAVCHLLTTYTWAKVHTTSPRECQERKGIEVGEMEGPRCTLHAATLHLGNVVNVVLESKASRQGKSKRLLPPTMRHCDPAIAIMGWMDEGLTSRHRDTVVMCDVMV